MSACRNMEVVEQHVGARVGRRVECVSDGMELLGLQLE